MNQVGGGGEKFMAAQQGLQRKVAVMGQPVLMTAPINKDAQGNVPVVSMQPDVAQATIGKGASGVSARSGVRIVGGTSPFGPEMGAPGFQPQPTPLAQQPAAPQAQQNTGLGAGNELHVLVATLEGPDGRRMEAVYEVEAPRGSKVLGVAERSAY
jgi:hypothetical protein